MSAHFKRKEVNTHMAETAELTFATLSGNMRIVRVPNPLPVVTPALLNDAAGRIIAANPFDDTIGELVTLKRAMRVNVERTEII